MMQMAHTCDLSRNAVVGTNGRRAMSALYTALPCLAMPMNTTTAIQHNFSLGRAYDFYFPDGQDVLPGDKLSWNSGSFIVKAVEPYLVPLIGHVRALTEQEVT